MAVEAVIYQQIVDMNWDQAIYTASPNDTINVAQFAAKGSGTNIAVALTPKGTGYISVQVPDNTTAGGNARGSQCIDLQFVRNAANQVAAGTKNTCIGEGNRTSTNTFGNSLFGAYNASIANESFVFGSFNICQAFGSYVFGRSNTTEAGAYILGRENAGNATSYIIGRYGKSELGDVHIQSSVRFAANGDCQKQTIYGKVKTTNDSPTLIDWSPTGLFIPANKLWFGTMTISGVKSDGSKIATYERNVTLSRVSSTTTLVASETIGTDLTNGTSISLSADDASDKLDLQITGVASETWRWMARFEFNDLGIGA